MSPFDVSRDKYARGVIDTAQALHGSYVGSSDAIDEAAAAAWLSWRITTAWNETPHPSWRAYDESVRHLALSALVFYEELRGKKATP